MTLTASATTTILGRRPQEVLEFVLDLEQYRNVDTKIVRVLSVEGPHVDGTGSALVLGRLRFTPPAPDRQDFELDRWQRITFRGAARQPARAVFQFNGTFECRSVPEGTEVTHAYSFEFTRPFSWLERVHRASLPVEVRDEMAKLAETLGQP